jgi:hypothetical protein
MPNVDTPYEPYPTIIIRTDPTVNPTFHLTVKEQLDLINSKPIGKKLLKGLHKGKAAVTFGFKVAILRAGNKVDNSTQDSKWSGGNVCKRTSEDKAKNGQGTTSAITYNPNMDKTPDGKRPPWIGLAHELCHALHNINGEALADIVQEENMTVGIGDYAGDKDAINENNIRKEHGIAPRTQYT